jgi:hypothetical protein
VIQIGVVVALAVQANVSGTLAFGVNEFSLVGFDVVHVCSDPETGRVVGIIVEEGPYVGDEVGIICDLYDDIVIYLPFFEKVPK